MVAQEQAGAPDHRKDLTMGKIKLLFIVVGAAYLSVRIFDRLDRDFGYNKAADISEPAPSREFHDRGFTATDRSRHAKARPSVSRPSKRDDAWSSLQPYS